MKIDYFFIAGVLLIIVNNLLFGIHQVTMLHGFQLFVSLLLLLFCIRKMMQFTFDKLPKKYEIPLVIAFILMARNTESIVRKGLIAYYPDFYQANKLYIFIVAVVLFFAVTFIFYQRVRRMQEVKAS
ncbi:hypothetical protein [Sphingobacterium faecale]|uniref:Uncharacterized protein n=1 Tax=Sphingobacterium faecale TaxID=2803775 RepID=A0ABS1R369_9SPHI|nr:hypothetical protein [Sphingobacterium faecale]MBL1408669.1 hypothetical protein [Sphingobacterium faecale]